MFSFPYSFVPNDITALLPVYCLSGPVVVNYTTSFPKGDNAKPANRKCIFPKGMPIMVM